ncbi:carbohydrate kinase family protein [Streptomyces asiaticus]
MYAGCTNCWSGCAPPTPGSPSSPARAEVPGLPVDALDPTGAGDVFVAGFMTGTLAGWPLADRLAFANLTAALSVQHFGGSLAAPGWPEVAAWWNRARRAADDGADTAGLARRYAFLGELIPDRVRGCPRLRALPTIGFRVHDSAQRP